MSKFTIINRLNHNVVICQDAQLKEVIVFGKGIGFNKNLGDSIDDQKIEKVYEIKDVKSKENYQKLVLSADENLIYASENIITKMVERFGQNYSEKLHVTLLDHLIFSVKRYRENITIGNIFLEEIKYLYPAEYQFSSEMLTLINRELGIDLPQSEIGFICMHVHSAIQHDDASFSALIVEIVGESLCLIECKMNIDLSQSSVLKQRLITHLKFAIKRAIDHIALENPIEQAIKLGYPQTYGLAKELADYIGANYDIVINEPEICYLTVHLQNILNAAQENKLV